jgi:hypothetical protein
MAAGIAAGVSALLDLFGTSWEDRIKEAAYKSPSGVRIRFYYEAVRRETDKRTAAFDFAGISDSYIQDNGHSSRRYPMRCIFWGDSCDLEATAFEAALLEKGVGKLEHPLYGTFDVVPFGTITRRDDLKNAANQVIVEVVFWSTVGAVYPQAQGIPSSEITAAIAGFDVVAAQSFANKVDFSIVGNALAVKGTIKGFIRDVSGALKQISDTVSSINREFRDLQRTINLALDVGIGQPLLLARQISDLIKAPARAIAGIQDRLEGYERLAQSIFGSDAGNPAQALEAGTALVNRRRRIANDFYTSDLFALNAVGGSVVSVVNTTFGTKPQALAAAEEVLAQFEEAIAWRDEGAGAIEEPDTGESYQAMQQAVAVTVGFLVEVSFSLVPERRIVIDRPRTIIDLAAELYGSVDDRLDLLISSNDLTGSEILELPRGRSIVYYP